MVSICSLTADVDGLLVLGIVRGVGDPVYTVLVVFLLCALCVG